MDAFSFVMQVWWGISVYFSRRSTRMALSTSGISITIPGPFGRSSTLPNRRTTSRWYSGTTLRVMKTRMTTMTAVIMNPVGIIMDASLFNLRTRRDVVHCCEQSRHLFLAGGQDHPLRLDAHELGRLQVRHNHDALAHQIFRRVLRADAGPDLAPLGSDIHLHLYKPGGLRHALGGDDKADAQRDLSELVDRDLIRW